MKYKNILLTGSSGKLGQEIVKSKCFPVLLTPLKETLDITNAQSIEKFFGNNEIDAVIHCAALARMAECEHDPARAITINIAGTSNLVSEVVKKEKIDGKNIRFVYLSTDGVYPGEKGNYSEQDQTIPYNKYGWTKLGGECAVRIINNYCIIRTSFFVPANIVFNESPTDGYSSKIPIRSLAQAIAVMLESDFVGVINVGGERKSEYERYKEFKPGLKPCSLEKVLKNVAFPMARDASLDLSLWKRIKSEQ